MQVRTTRTTRLIAGAAAALLGLAAVPGEASAAVSTQTLCAGVPSGQSGFTDLGQAGTHARNVECLKGTGITSGETATTYNPPGLVSRAQMANFIARMIDEANDLDAPGGTTIPDLPTAGAAPDAFTDDENATTAEDNINRLAAANVVQGKTATTFAPTENVTRAQMATFIAEALSFIRGGALPAGQRSVHRRQRQHPRDEHQPPRHRRRRRRQDSDHLRAGRLRLPGPDGLVHRAGPRRPQRRRLHHRRCPAAPTPRWPSRRPTPSRSSTPTPSRHPTTSPATTGPTPSAGSTAGQGFRITLVQCSLVTNTNGQFSFRDNDGDAHHERAGRHRRPGHGRHGRRPPRHDQRHRLRPRRSGDDAVRRCRAARQRHDHLRGRRHRRPAVPTPIIYTDQGGANTRLNLDAQGRPTEPFGIGGSINTGPAEAPIGNQGGSVTVATVNPGADLFTANNLSFLYDTGDTVQFQGAGITLAQFEGILSAGDTVAVSYNPDAAGVSSFNVFTDVNGNVPTVAAALSNRDGDAAANDVTVTITPAAGAPAGTTYQVQRAPVTQVGATCGDGDDTVGAFANVGAAGTATTVNDDDRAAGCYAYRATGTDPLTGATSGPSAPSNAIVVA